MYRLEELSEGRRANLERHYPAVGLSGLASSFYIWPKGHLELRLSSETAWNCPTISETDVNWIHLNNNGAVPASYHQERTGLHPLSYANQSSIRDALIQRAYNEHSIINPMEDIPGLGELSFLSEEDRLEVVRRGYSTAQEVSMARRRGIRCPCRRQ